MSSRCPETPKAKKDAFLRDRPHFSSLKPRTSRWLAVGVGLLLLWVMGPATGQVYHWKSETYVGGVEVRSGASPSDPALGMTDAFGRIATQTGELNLRMATGAREQSAIRASDALAALRMAVGLTPQAGGEPASPFQYWAADVNGDGRVTAADALEILKQAVRSPEAVEKRWIFVPEALVTDSPPPTRQRVPNPGVIQPGQAVVAVLVGDVLGTWVPPTDAIARGTVPPPPGGDSGVDPGPTPVDPEPSDWRGTWVGQCLFDNDNVSYKQSVFEFREDEKLVNYKAEFSDGSCEQDLFRLENIGEYGIGSAFISPSTGFTAYEVDLRTDEVWLTLNQPGQAEVLNNKAFCERTDWHTGTRTEITDCPEISTAEVFNIISIQNEASGRVLYIGDASGDGQTPGTRPTHLDVNQPYFLHRKISFFEGDGGEAFTQTGLSGGMFQLPSAGFTRPGYSFAGWNMATDGGGTAYAPGESLTISAEDVTLYAQWQVNQYTLTFDSAGGSVVTAITQNFGSAITPPTNPMRAGYAFTGWSPEIPDTIPAENQTFTAQWQINQYNCPDCPQMVLIPSGSFVMGSPENELERRESEGPQRTVTVPGFALGETSVTVAQWNLCAADGGCPFVADTQGGERLQHPVTDVSWFDAQQYVTWLSGKTGFQYRLPSEAEYEYATRAGTAGRFYTGDCITTDDANFSGWQPAQGCPEGAYLANSTPVKTYPANPWGLYDMVGNTQDWVQDCWNDNYSGAPTDGSAWLEGQCHLAALKGAAWHIGGRYIRSANRNSDPKDLRFYAIGFRVARNLD
jgi:uncharacterized repeat protein (TIGR02543 family)